MTTVMLIFGMRDTRCREVVAETLESLPGVVEVDVNLFRARATVSHEPLCTSHELLRAVLASGYDASLEGVSGPDRDTEQISQEQREQSMSLIKSELKAKDIMTLDPVCVTPATRIRELARVFEEHEISGAPVIDQEGRVVGVVSKTDLIRRCSEGTDDIPPAYLFEVLSDQGEQEDASEVVPEPLVCVDDFMTADPLMVDPEMSAASIARLMFEKRVHRVIVADDDRFPLGMITSMDLLGVFSR